MSDHTSSPSLLARGTYLFVMLLAGCLAEPGTETAGAVAPYDDVELGTTTQAVVFQQGTSVNITTGPITGTTASSDLRVFKGIPYVRPPVGALRFAPPAYPAASWSTPRDATAFGAPCIQAAFSSTSLGYKMPTTPAASEDCLTLNVWAKNDAASRRPVMVWLHGGAFVSGGSSGNLFDGANLTRNGNLVVVTINYRLGALGFLVHDSLKAGSSALGNYGLLDQRAALQWVKDNIVAFGGDPNNVTLFGESAGGASVCAHLAMPASSALFHKAIIESGGNCSEFPTLTTSTVTPIDPTKSGGATARGLEFMSATPCAGMSGTNASTCLRGLTTDQILSGQAAIAKNFFGSLMIGPVVDGVTLTGEPYALLRADKTGLKNKPLIVGANANEPGISITSGTINNHYAGWVYTWDDYSKTFAPSLLGRSSAKKTRLDQIYSGYIVPSNAIIDVLQHDFYSCPAAGLAKLFGTKGYHYEFRSALSGGDWFFGPTHGIEVAFVFGNDAITGTLWSSPEDTNMSLRMIGLWSSFASTGTPAASPAWRNAAANAGSYVLNDSSTAMVNPLPVTSKCTALGGGTPSLLP